MIRQFPNFSKLSLADKYEVHRLTSKFAPYSDFNFTSLFCWDVDSSTEVAELNGNLIIKMADYVTGLPLYTLLGDRRIDETLDCLSEITKSIQLVPEVVVRAIKSKERFNIHEDRDQFDYVYSLREQADLAGGRFKIKRNKISKFMRQYGGQLSIRRINFKDPACQHELAAVVRNWATNRQKDDGEIERESLAIVRLCEQGRSNNLTGIKLYIGEECIGFSVNEIINSTYALCHFQKSILDFENADVFLSSIVAKELVHFGCAYVNWEQDLGISGLRYLKESYNPDFFLKKYTISKAAI